MIPPSLCSELSVFLSPTTLPLCVCTAIASMAVLSMFARICSSLVYMGLDNRCLNNLNWAHVARSAFLVFNPYSLLSSFCYLLSWYLLFRSVSWFVPALPNPVIFSTQTGCPHEAGTPLSSQSGRCEPRCIFSFVCSPSDASIICLLVVVEEIPTSLLGTPSLPLGLVQFSLLLVS